MLAEGGIGLAAPQVGISKRLITVFIPRVTDRPLLLFNPVIISQDGEQEGIEGCLSFPGERISIKRPEFVKVGYQDGYGENLTIEGRGILATCLFHELDHLDGKLFIDYREKE